MDAHLFKKTHTNSLLLLLITFLYCLLYIIKIRIKQKKLFMIEMIKFCILAARFICQMFDWVPIRQKVFPKGCMYPYVCALRSHPRTSK